MPPEQCCGVRGAAVAVERIWHIQESQGHILALASRQTSFTRLTLFFFARKRDRSLLDGQLIWGHI